MTNSLQHTDPDFARTVDSDIVQRAATVKPARLLSIDVLRGLTIAFMIIVNDQVGGHPFRQLDHAQWNGFTATDLVFPTFLFLVGLSTVLSTAARLARGVTRQQLFLHTLRRAVVLVLLGFVVNWFPFFHMATARYYGVLQRIGLCYLIVGTLFLISRGWKDKVVLAFLCLAGYWALMRFVPVPGFGVPTHDVAINDFNGTLNAWLDRQLFSPQHLYQKVRDPEGLLSTMPAIATALFGMISGLWLRSTATTVRKATMLAFAGVVFLGIALAWDPYFPINKKLWTSTFALFAGGWSLLLLAASIAVVDILRLGRSAAETDAPESPQHPLLYRPLLVLGTNAILAYMVSELGADLIYRIRPGGVSLAKSAFEHLSRVFHDPRWCSLVYSLIYLLVCWLLVLPFYRKRIFFRV